MKRRLDLLPLSHYLIKFLIRTQPPHPSISFALPFQKKSLKVTPKWKLIFFCFFHFFRFFGSRKRVRAFNKIMECINEWKLKRPIHKRMENLYFKLVGGTMRNPFLFPFSSFASLRCFPRLLHFFRLSCLGVKKK